MKMHYSLHKPYTLCGVKTPQQQLTADRALVTCKICIRELQKG